VLKQKFTKLFNEVVDNIDANTIKGYLFARGVISKDASEEQGNTRKERHQLLNLLFRSGHPETFIQLYFAIKNETQLQWLVKKIDEMSS